MFAENFAIYAFAFVLTYAIHSTLLLGGACLLVGRVARESLRLRERLWKVALFGGVVTAAVQVAVGWHTPLAHWTIDDRPSTPLESANVPSPRSDDARLAELEQRRAELVRQLREASRSEPQLIESTPPASSLESSSTTPVALVLIEMQALAAQRTALAAQDETASARGEDEAPPTLAALGAAPTNSAVSHWRDLEWRAWLAGGLAAWGAFALLVIALFAWMWLRLARRLRGRHELVDGELRAMLDALTVPVFAHRPVRLFVAPELRTPVSFGWLRRTICVPPRALTELTRDEQETMLAHELAHLARRDPLWLSLAWLVERVFFFQPLNRVARAELHDLAELLCDDWAAVRTGNRVALASCLARIASWIVGGERALPATSMADARGRSRLGQRIERLLDDGIARRDGDARRAFVPLATLLLTSAVFVAPGVAAATFEAATEVPDETTDEHAGGPTGEAEESSCESPEFSADTVDELAIEAELAQPSAPAPQPAAAPAPALQSDIAALDEAVFALEKEIAGLRRELSELDLDDDLGAMVDELDTRAVRLARRRARLHQLLDQTLLAPTGYVLGGSGGAPLELNVR